jgi:hypothetical protein
MACFDVYWHVNNMYVVFAVVTFTSLSTPKACINITSNLTNQVCVSIALRPVVASYGRGKVPHHRWLLITRPVINFVFLNTLWRIH